MPAFSWLIVEDGEVKTHNCFGHSCFAPLASFPGQRYNGLQQRHPAAVAYAPRTLFVASHGSWPETKRWADEVSKAFGDKHKFVLKAHHYSTKKNNPGFGEDEWRKRTDNRGVSFFVHGAPELDKVCYWSITWPDDTRFDEFYAVTKLIFKNVTYTKHSLGHMVRILEEGGTVWEAMLFQAIFEKNGYTYPTVPDDERTAKEAIKFGQEGPSWPAKGSWRPQVLSQRHSHSIYNADHSPVYRGGNRFISLNPQSSLTDLRNWLNKKAGIKQ